MSNTQIRDKKLTSEITINIVLALMVIIPIAVGVFGFIISGQPMVGISFSFLTFALITLILKLNK